MNANRLTRSIVTAFAGLALFALAACGGSSTPAATESAPPPAPAAKVAPAVKAPAPAPAPTDTAAPAPTDTPEPAPAPTDTPEPAPEPTDTPEPEPTDTPGYDAAVLMAGDWVGEWNNLTYGSSGPPTASIVVREDGTASITFDLDGFVFGLLDPPAITFDMNFDADGVVYDKAGDSLFGDLTLTVTADVWTIMAESEAAFIVLEVEGTLSPDLIDATYTVGAPDDSWTADGTFVLQRP